MTRSKGDPTIATASAAAIIAVLCVTSAVLLVDGGAELEDELTMQLSNGFTAAHAAGAPVPFEPVLYAPSGAFAFGFLRVGAASLDLAVVHLPSSFPVWRATPARLGNWSLPATLTFDDGSLVLLTAHDDDDSNGVLWQTLDAVGDVVVLLDSSNLVVRRYEKTVPEWESFRHPSDTLVLGQNFTGSSPPLVSANRRFALRLGKTYMALRLGKTYMALPTRRTPRSRRCTVYGRLDASGFFGLYLEGGRGDELRVDVLSFDTFADNLTGVFRRMTLDDDGNLRAYYWANGSKAWTSDYMAISEPCELPTPCGAYGLCVPGKAECQCLDNSTSAFAATDGAPSCHVEETTAADLCAAGTGQQQQQDLGVGFDVVRRNRVTVAYKEELPFETNRTAAECEAACAANCSCWAALHSGGASGYCYLIDFPVETMVYEADDRKVGYFKVRRPKPASGMSPGVSAATAALSLVLVGLAAAGACIGYRIRERTKRRRGGGMEQELVPVPYMDIRSMNSSDNSIRA